MPHPHPWRGISIKKASGGIEAEQGLETSWGPVSQQVQNQWRERCCCRNRIDSRCQYASEMLSSWEERGWGLCTAPQDLTRESRMRIWGDSPRTQRYLKNVSVLPASKNYHPSHSVTFDLWADRFGKKCLLVVWLSGCASVPPNWSCPWVNGSQKTSQVERRNWTRRKGPGRGKQETYLEGFYRYIPTQLFFVCLF